MGRLLGGFCNEATERFISDNASVDVRRLALSTKKGGTVDVDFALNQIAGRAAAKTKLPSFAAECGVIYPPRINMEQCSSERAALYKAALARRLCAGDMRFCADITGGFGVDFTFLAKEFGRGLYVERNPMLCDIVSHNLAALGLGGTTDVVCADGVAYIEKIDSADLIMIDPSRRDGNGKRVFALSDCEPDVTRLLPDVFAHTRLLLAKLSPMLDWTKACGDLNPYVREVHIVAVGGECKELLAVMQREWSGDVEVFCADDDRVVSFPFNERTAAQRIFAGDVKSLENSFLYEPNAAVMKSGFFGTLCRRHSVEALDANSHLFVGDAPTEGFPGDRFRIVKAATMNRRELKAALSTVSDGSVSVRNFPLSAAELARRLKVREGSSYRIFGTTAQGKHIILVTEKA